MSSPTNLYVCKASAGTGKTYTLSAYYVALLMAGESYRTILAVTFTNKATIEMKERILTYLYGMSHQPSLVDIRDFMDKVREMGSMLNENGLSNRVALLSDEEMSERASVLFRTILADYDNMRVSTIDSFLQLLLTGMARSLSKAAGFNVSLDSDQVISEAVDQLMTTHITTEEGLDKMLYEYVSEKMLRDDNWNIRSGLLNIAKELTKESVQCQPIDRDPKRVNRFIMRIADMDRSNTTAENNYNLTVRNLRDMMMLDFIRRRMNQNLTEQNSVLLADTARILDEALRQGDADFILEQVGIRYHHIMLDEFQDTSTLQWRNFERLIESVLSEGGTVFIVGDVKQSIYRFRNGDWSIMAGLTPSHSHYGAYCHPMSLSCNFRSQKHVVQFNQRLFALLQPYTMLLNEKLAAFYNEQYSDKALPLYYQTRERDKKNHIGHEYGYVQLKAYPCYIKPNKDLTDAQLKLKSADVREKIVLDMFDTMDRLMAAGSKAKDMLVLTRGHKDASYIISLFEEHKMTREHLQCATITSRDSFLLSNSPSVLLLISALQLIFLHDNVAGEYINQRLGECVSADLLRLNRHMPLFELVQRIMSRCLMSDTESPSDVAYVNAFMDNLRLYIATYGSDVETFLQYWNDKLQNTPIPVTEADSIRVMTVHTSKGLEAENVFVPFCNWSLTGKDTLFWAEQQILPSDDDDALGLVPISGKDAELNDSAYQSAYEEELLAQRVDNLNLLYVALTRAADRLYISLPVVATKEGFGFSDDYKNVGHLLVQHLQQEDGTPLTVAVENCWKNCNEGECVVCYSLGSESWVKEQKKDTSKADKPFSFEGLSDEQLETVHLLPENMEIQFRQSQESLQYALYGVEKGEERIRRKEFGTLCHDVMAAVSRREDLDYVLQDFMDRAIIEDETMLHEVRSLINRAWKNPQMCDWFSGRYTLMREEAMLALIDGEVSEKRMDRVMIDPLTNSAIVLDYKFGYHDKDDYHRQVLLYMDLLRRMGYDNVKGYLWFAHSSKLVEIV